MSEETNRHALGQRLKQARLRAGADRGREYRQAEVAGVLGVAASTVSQWESGLSEPTLAVLEALADLFSVDAGALAFGSAAERAEARRLAEERRQRARETVKEIAQRVAAKKHGKGKDSKPRTARGG